MIGIFIHKIRITFSDEALRRRIYFLLAALILFRVLANIPIPGIDTSSLERFFSDNSFFGMMSMFSGGGLQNLSLIMLGVGPYITASIIMQLSTILSSKMKALQSEEGEIGRMKFAQYSKYLTIPIAFLQGYSFLTLLQKQNAIPVMDTSIVITNVLIIVAGAMLLTWIGELVTEFGIGNGVSLIIFAGIVAAIPSKFMQVVATYEPSQIPTYIAFLVMAVIVTAGVVFLTEAERPVPITYSRQARRSVTASVGADTYLPIRVNQAGVIPIIFALSLLIMPQMVAQVLTLADAPAVASAAQSVVAFLNNTFNYAALYFVLVFGFTYFYTAVTFDPDQVATNLQKNGGYINGVRPGEATAEYLGHIVTRVTLFGALFLSAVAVLPFLMKLITENQSLTLGGTALLIVVSVVLDLVKKIDAQVSIREF